MRHIETDSLSNQNIATALAIGAYTSDGDKSIIVDVCVDAVAGGGDYVMHVTKRIGGAGSSYVILPKTTMTAAAGETAISGQSGVINTRNGDVLTVYVVGLAGDTTTPDTIVRWFETESDVKLAATQTGVTIPTVTTLTNLPAVTTDWLTAAAVKADAVTKIQLGLATSVGLAAVMAWASAAIAASYEAGAISQIRGNSWSIAMTSLTLDTNKQQFSIKRKPTDLDSEAILFVDSTTGLITINGASGTATDATLVYGGTTLTLTVKTGATAQLPTGTFHYGIQSVTAAGIVTESYGGTFSIVEDIVRATV